MIRNGFASAVKPGIGVQLDRSHPAARGLVACWLFNENTGSVCYDLAGSYHFALTGGVSRLAGPHGPAIKFDGTSGQGVSAGHPLASATAFTVILRLRQKDGLSSPYGPYLGSNQNYNSGFYIGQNTPALMQFWVGGSDLDIPVTNDAWGHYAAVWSAATLVQSGYANGVLSVNRTGIMTTIPAYTNAYIGKASATGGGYFTDSWLGWMKVYNRALSAAEIAADYATPYALFAPPAARRFFSVASGSALVKSLTETLSLSDARAAAVAHSLTETLSLTDARSLSPGRALSEALAFTDSRSAATGKGIAEALSLTDGRAAQVARPLVESVSLSDTVTTSSGSPPLVYVVSYTGPTTVGQGTAGPIAFQVTARGEPTLPRPTSAQIRLMADSVTLQTVDIDPATISPGVTQTFSAGSLTFPIAGQYAAVLRVVYPSGDVATGSVPIVCNRYTQLVIVGSGRGGLA